MLKGGPTINSDTYHETIGTSVLCCTVYAQMLITTCIVDLYFYLALLNIFDALVDIENGGLIILCKAILEVVANQTWFTYRSVSYKNYFYILLHALAKVLLAPLGNFDRCLIVFIRFYLFKRFALSRLIDFILFLLFDEPRITPIFRLIHVFSSSWIRSNLRIDRVSYLLMI